MISADIFSHFSYEMGKSQFYPPGAPELSENHLSAWCMLVLLSKNVIMSSLQDCQGTDGVVLASVAMGMGID